MAEKRFLSLTEAAAFVGLSKSCFYQMTKNRQVPHYKPNGGKVFFDPAELEAWVKSFRVSTKEELQQKAQAYCMQKGGLK